MLYTYLIVFSPKINRDDLTNYLKTVGISKNWFYNTPFAVFVNSENTAKEISQKIVQKFGKTRHIVVKVNKGDYFGLLPKEHWIHFK